MEQDISTDSGALNLNGDSEDNASGDSPNTLGFTDLITVTAKTVLSLEATTGAIVPAGRLTLVAGSGVVISDNMTGGATAKALVIDADFESEGDGTISVANGKTVTSNKSDVTLTAWDLDLDGSLTAGTQTLSIHGSKTAQTIGMADTAANMHIGNDELTKLTEGDHATL